MEPVWIQVAGAESERTLNKIGLIGIKGIGIIMPDTEQAEQQSNSYNYNKI